jgi:hypothetical protein
MSPCQSNKLAILGQSVDLKNMFEIRAITEQNHRLKRIYAKMACKMSVSRRRLENSAKVVSKEKGGRNDRKRSDETANWLGIQVDVSSSAMHVLRSLSQIIKWRESLKPCGVITGPNMSIVC